MRIRYSKDDPRAGTIVDLEEGLARRKIDAGEAEEVTGKAAETDADRATAAANPNEPDAGGTSATDSGTTAAARTPAKTGAKTTAGRAKR